MCSQDWEPLSQGEGGRHVNQQWQVSVPWLLRENTGWTPDPDNWRSGRDSRRKWNVRGGHSRSVTDRGIFQGSFCSHVPIIFLWLTVTQLALSQMEPVSFKDSEPVIVKLALVGVRLPLPPPFASWSQALVLTPHRRYLFSAWVWGSAAEPLAPEGLIRTGNQEKVS